MTTKIFRVEFANGFHCADIVAKSIAQAIRIATRLFREDTNQFVKDEVAEGNDKPSSWKTYVREGHTKVTTVELLAESDN